VLAEFSHRQIDYFHGLPPALKGTETVRNGALALVHLARALRALGKLEVAGADAAEAVQLLERLREGGDHSEATTIALGLAYGAQARVLESRNDAADLPTAQRAAALLRPLAEAPDASAAARRAYVDILVRIGFKQQQSANGSEDAIRTEREVMRIATDLGARNLSDLDAGAYYAEACAWAVQALENLGRYGEARGMGEDCMALADQVLERRPGYRLALHAQGVIAGVLVAVATDELDPKTAMRMGLRQEQVQLTLLRLDPNNIVSINNFAVAESQLGDSLWTAGHLREAVPFYLKQLDYAGRASAGGALFAVGRFGAMAGAAVRQAQSGEVAAAAATLAAGAPFLAKLRQSEPPGSMAVVLADGIGKDAESWVAFERGDALTARRLAAETVSELQAVTPRGGAQEFSKYLTLHFSYSVEGRAEYQLGDFAAAERSEAKALEASKATGADATDDQRRRAEASTWIAMAQVRQGHLSEAARTIGPVVKFERELAARNHGDQWLPLELAAALYAEALSNPKEGAANLRQAARLIDGLPPQMQSTHDVRQWRERIRQAQGAG
jgi:tetratricopeptide (TPR) repeat protein